MAIGAIAEPVPPLILSGCTMKANSWAPAAGKLFEHEVLQKIDAVLDQHHGMDRKVVRRLGRPHLDAAIVGGDQHRVLRDQPLAGRNADAGVGTVP